MPVRPLLALVLAAAVGHHSWASPGYAVLAYIVQVEDRRTKRPRMSSKRVTMHRRCICAMRAGILLLLSAWLPVATANTADRVPGTRERHEKVRAAAIRRATLVGLAVIVVSAGPVAAMAAPLSPEPGNDGLPGPTIVQVHGRQFRVDAGQGRYSMLGDLNGHWTVRSARGLAGYSIPEEPWTLVQTGQERFIGCLDRNYSQRCDPGEPSGSLAFDYVLWMQYDPDSGWLIKDPCLHPITGGSGDFAGARGVLIMRDGPVGRGEQVNSTYKGEIVLNAVPSERAVPQNDDAPADLLDTRR
jgi:hypothetical protein